MGHSKFTVGTAENSACRKGTPMTTMAMHDYAPIIASGSNKQFIKIFNTSGKC